jgi:hypothetical protein
VTNGTYNLTFTKNYYHPIFYTLNINGSKPIYWLNITFIPYNGTLYLNVYGIYNGNNITLRPNIYYNNENITSKFSITILNNIEYLKLSLGQGSYNMTLKLDGWNSVNIKFNITSENVTIIEERMYIKWAEITINLNIPEAYLTIYPNQTLSGNRTILILNGYNISLYPDPYTLYIYYIGYLGAYENITLKPGEHLILNISLSKATAYLVGYMSPEQGKIYFGNMVVNVSNGSYSIGLAPGNYRFTFSSNGYENYTISIALNVGKNWLNVTLVKLINLTIKISGMAGMSVQGVNVILKGNNLTLTGTANVTGVVIFKNIPSGKYTVLISGNNIKEYYFISTTNNTNQLISISVYSSTYAQALTTFNIYTIFSIIILMLITYRLRREE